MNTDLLIGVGPLVALLAVTGLLLCLLGYPLWRTYPDDGGDGNALVLLPPPKLPALHRAPVFVLVFAGMVIVTQSVTGWANPNELYIAAVSHITASVVRAPAELKGNLNDFEAGLRFLVAGSIVCLGLLGRGSPARRLVVMSSAVWYLAAMITVDSLLAVVQAVAGLPVGPSTLLGTFAVIALGFMAMTRTMLANYCTPRPSLVPFAHRPRLADALTLIAVTLASMAVMTAAVLYLYHLADPDLKPLLPVLLPVPFAEGTIVLRTLALALLVRGTAPPEPPVADVRAPIDVIIPAYNEEEMIVETLRAVDAAARRHGGTVNVILCNDGSTDRTGELVAAAMRDFRYARGRMIEGRHGGKSATLNAALAATTSDVVVRIDADTLVDQWCLYYVQRWFEDPRIGLVEALMWPRWRRSVFPRIRLFEELRQFGMNHRTIEVVDGVNVVPGVFTAFRRDVAVALDGFTVGMNGEDGDFTLRFSRMGYRTHLDPRVIVYEDVPPTYLQIREQRIRWTRGMIHNHARHGPYRAGLGTPKVWFSQAHLFYAKTFRPLRLMFFFYLLVVAVFEGAYRGPVLTFLGAYTIAVIGFIAIGAALAVGYRKGRYVAWSLAWPLWAVCTNVFSVESWLSLPGRPTGVRGARVEHVATPVVH